jgi:ribosome-binding factor A
MSIRTDKINSLLQQEVSRIFLEGILEGVAGLVTVSSVEVTPDLSRATVWLGVYDGNPASVLALLRRKRREIQEQLYKRLFMRPVPRLIFRYDPGFAQAQRVSEILSELQHETEGKKRTPRMRAPQSKSKRSGQYARARAGV